MTCYVDELQRHGARQWCHLIADSMPELHAMVAAIGGKRAWFQGFPKASFPHYDLQRRLRAAAVARGAVELERRPFVMKLRELRPRFGILRPSDKKVVT